MRPPTLLQTPPDPARTGRRHRLLIPLAAGVLVLLIGVAASAFVAANRPASTTAPVSREPVTVATGPATGATDPAAAPVQSQQRQPAPDPTSPRQRQNAVLANGSYDAYVRTVNVRGGTIVVDLIQVFTGESAVRAAIEDGKPSAEAKDLQYWVRNQNRRLRTLPVARNVQMVAPGACEGDQPLTGRNTVLAKVARDPNRTNRNWYYAFTLKDGAVQRIDPRLAAPAC
jgi:hypothetical protein